MTSQTFIVKLKFPGGAHFGEAGIGLERCATTIHSDTLFGALCHSWGVRYDRKGIKDLLDQFENGSPPFLISSSFLYCNRDFFLPKPMTQTPQIIGVDDVQARKEIKRLDHLPLPLFRRWIAGRDIELSELRQIKKINEIAQVQLRPHVTLDRASCTSQIYHAGYVHFAPQAGLYFLVQFHKSDLIDSFWSALELLGEMGLGGNRSSGSGHFRIESNYPANDEWSNLLSETFHERCCLLSLFYPCKTELSALSGMLKFCRYRLLERCGWSNSPFCAEQLKRKSVAMFAEGSIFTQEFRGELADVTPSEWEKDTSRHPLYRYGYAFYLNLPEPRGA